MRLEELKKRFLALTTTKHNKSQTNSLKKLHLQAELLEDRTVPTTIVFQEGLEVAKDGIGTGVTYFGTQETEIYQGAPGAVQGDNQTISVDGSTGGRPAQGLMRFDNIFGPGEGQIPLGSTINSASITLYVTSPGSPVNFHRMLVDWNEDTASWGTFGSETDPRAVETNGVEAASTVDSAVDGAPGNGSNRDTQLAVLPNFGDFGSALRAWANGESNFGWVIDYTGGDGYDFDTSENTDVRFDGGTQLGLFENRPKLTVDFTPPTGPGRIQLADINFDVNEGDGNATVTLTRNFGTDGAASVDLNVSNGTALRGADYTGTSFNVNFADGQNSATVEIPIINDNAPENDETINLSLNNFGGASEGVQSTGTVTIVDNDGAGIFEFESSELSVSESVGTATITVNRLRAADGVATVDYVLGTGSTATSGTDFTLTAGTLTFNDGETSKTFTVTIADDTVIEGSETVVLQLSNPTGGGALGANDTSTVTIFDNELLLNEIHTNPPGDDGQFEYVELVGSPGLTLAEGSSNVYLLVIEGDFAGGDAGRLGRIDDVVDLGAAQVGSNGLLVIQASNTGGFPVPAGTGFFAANPLLVNNDTVSFFLVLSPEAPTEGTDLDPGNSGQIDISALPAGSILLDGIGWRDRGTGDVAYGAVLLQNNGTPDAASRFLIDGQPDPRPFAADAWYNGDILNTSDNSSTTYNTEAASNNLPIGARITPGAPNTLPENVFQFTQSSNRVNEQDGSITLTVVRSNPTQESATLNFTTADGSATAGEDYTTTDGTLTFAPGAESATITVPILSDLLAEGNENFTVTVSNPSLGELGAIPTVNVTIIPNDVFQVSQPSAQIGEGDGSITLTVLRTNPSDRTVTVDFTTADGNATESDDYTETNGTLTFAPNETSKTITVLILEDTIPERNEQFTLQLDNAAGGGTLGSQVETLVTIIDNDTTRIVFQEGAQVLINDVGAVDGNGNPIIYTGTQDTEVNNFTPNSDLGQVPNISVDGSNSAPGGIGTGQAQGLIRFDNIFGTGNGQVPLGSTIFAAAVTVNINSVSQATGDIDFHQVLPGITGGTWTESSTWNTLINGVSRDDIEAAETIDSSLENPNQGGVRTITDLEDAVQAWAVGGTNLGWSIYNSTNDGWDFATSEDGSVTRRPRLTISFVTPTGPGAFSFSQPEYEVDENGGNATITVYRTGGTDGTATVDYATSAGTATAGSDYTTTTGTLSFSAGQFQNTFTIPITNDSDLEGTENLTVTLSNPTSGATLGEQASATVTIVDDEFDTNLVINEIEHNPPGTDAPFEYIELRGTPDAPLDNIWLVELEGDTQTGRSEAAGRILNAYDLTGFRLGANGLLVITQDGGHELPDETNVYPISGGFGGNNRSYLLVRSELKINVNDDADSLDQFGTPDAEDGVIDSETVLGQALILDAIGWIDAANRIEGQNAYVYGGASVSSANFIPNAVTRFLDNNVKQNASSWYSGLLEPEEGQDSLIYDQSNGSPNLPSGAILTPGGENVLASNIFRFEQEGYTVNETDGTLTVTVERLFPSNSSVTVNYATSDDTALAGSDYTATNGTLTFGPGVETATFTVDITDDSDLELPEDFLLTLSNPSAGVVDDQQGQVAATIESDDGVTVFLTFQQGVNGYEDTQDATLAVGAPDAPRNVNDVDIDSSSREEGLLRFDNIFGVAMSQLPVGALITTASVMVTFNGNGDTVNVHRALGDWNEETITWNSFKFNGNDEGGVQPDGLDATPVLRQFPGQGATATFDATDDLRLWSSAPAANFGWAFTPTGSDSTDFLSSENPNIAARPLLTVGFLSAGPAVEFDVANVQVSEDAGNAVLTVTRDGDLSGTTTVDFTTVDGTAVDGTDYTATSGTLTFAPTETTKTITVPIIDNTDPAANSVAFSVALSNQSEGFLNPPDATVTIDDDETIQVTYQQGKQILIDGVGAVDGNGDPIIYMGTQDTDMPVGGNTPRPNGTAINIDTSGLIHGLTRFDDIFGTGSTQIPLGSQIVSANLDLFIFNPGNTVQLHRILGDWSEATTTWNNFTLNGNAQGGIQGDNVEATGVLRTFSGGSALPRNIPVTDDLQTWSDGTTNYGWGFTPTGSNGVDWFSSEASDADVRPALTVLFAPPDLRVQFSQSDYAISEDGGTATITVTRTGPTDEAVTVEYATSDGSATAGSDYTAATGTVTIPAGETQATFTVTITDDTTVEGPETINLTLTNPSAPAEIGIRPTAVLTIADQDLLLNEVNVNTPGTDQPFEYVELKGTATGNLANIYFVAVEGDGSGAGTADLVVDLSSVALGSNGLLVIKSESGGFTIPTDTTVVTDPDFNADQDGALENGSISFLVVLSPTAIIEGTDLDTNNDGTPDALPAGAVVVDAISWTDGDGGDIVYGGVQLSSDDPGAATRFLDNTDPLSLGGWYYGDHFDTAGNASTAYNPADGDTSANLPDAGRITPGAPNTQGDFVFFAVTSTEVDETAGTVTVDVTRIGDISSPVTVDFTTEDGSATAGSDYTAKSETLTFAANDAVETITVDILNDDDIDPNESFTIVLGNPTNGVEPIFVTTTGVTIVDDETSVVVFQQDQQITINGVGVVEGNSDPLI